MHAFPSGLEQLNSNRFDVIRMCALWRREQVAGADCALVFAAGPSDVWLCKHPALWTDETAAKCVQLFCRKEWPMKEPTISVQIC